MNKYIAFSGGKDSTALALLFPDSIPVFTDTGAEFPETHEHIDRFEQVTSRKVLKLKSKYGSLLEYIKKTKYLPGHRSRFCTRIFKIETFQNFTNTYSVALRSDEERIGNSNKNVDYPLQDMGVDKIEVIKICTEYNLLPRYPVYMARGGCINCFYKRKSEIYAMNSFVPEILDRLQKLEEGIQDERGKFAKMFPNTNMSIRELRQQTVMFTPEEIYQDAGNKSDYGIACGLFCNR